jgi:hypothetical protein
MLASGVSALFRERTARRCEGGGRVENPNLENAAVVEKSSGEKTSQSERVQSQR